MSVAFVDTETTGLDADRHEIWEVGLIVDDDEYLWHLPVDLGRADPIALRIGGFHERYSEEKRLERTPFTHLAPFAEEFARHTRGRHLVGAVVSFDEERLRKLLKANGACPEWHYHQIDVEALAVGWLNGQRQAGKPLLAHQRGQEVWGLPWRSEALSKAVGVDPTMFDRHTALGDVRWAKAIYDACMSG